MYYIGSIICLPYDIVIHYGVKGQQWGVRNGPPYPLIRGDYHNRMRKRNRPEFRYRTPVAREVLSQYKKEQLSELKKLDHPMNDDDLYRINHPTPREDGHAYNCPNCAAAFELLCRGYDVQANPAQHGSNVGNIERFFVNGRLDCVSPDIEFPEAPKVPVPWDGDPRTRRKREKIWDKFYDARRQMYKNLEQQTTEHILSQGEAARGIIVVGWNASEDGSVRTTAFHAFNYRVENGSIMWYDTQSSGKCVGYPNMRVWSDYVDPRDVYIMRTDNLELSEHITSAVHSSRR